MEESLHSTNWRLLKSLKGHLEDEKLSRGLDRMIYPIQFLVEQCLSEHVYIAAEVEDFLWASMATADVLDLHYYVQVTHRHSIQLQGFKIAQSSRVRSLTMPYSVVKGLKSIRSWSQCLGGLTRLCAEGGLLFCHISLFPVMWDFPLYAVNMFYYHQLIKKLIWAYGSTEQSKAGIPSRQREKEGGVREMPCSCLKRQTPRNLTGKTRASW